MQTVKGSVYDQTASEWLRQHLKAYDKVHSRKHCFHKFLVIMEQVFMMLSVSQGIGKLANPIDSTE